jgi:Mg2+/Co2+ transporter CorC
MSYQNITTVYAKAINQIDDLFEYRYAAFSAEQLKTMVMQIIDDIPRSLDKIHIEETKYVKG